MAHTLVFSLWAKRKERSLVDGGGDRVPIPPQRDYSKWPGTA